MQTTTLTHAEAVAALRTSPYAFDSRESYASYIREHADAIHAASCNMCRRTPLNPSTYATLSPSDYAGL